MCSPTVPVSSFLFGDDLNKEVEDLTKANRLGNKVAPKQRVGPYQFQRGHVFRGSARGLRALDHGKQSNWKGRGPFFRTRPRPVSELSELSELSKQTATITTRKSVTEEVCENRISTLIEFQRPFMAGQLQNYIANWQRLTSDPVILDVVAHCHIEFEDEPLLSSNCCIRNDCDDISSPEGL